MYFQYYIFLVLSMEMDEISLSVRFDWLVLIGLNDVSSKFNFSLVVISLRTTNYRQHIAQVSDSAQAGFQNRSKYDRSLGKILFGI